MDAPIPPWFREFAEHALPIIDEVFAGFERLKAADPERFVRAFEPADYSVLSSLNDLKETCTAIVENRPLPHADVLWNAHVHDPDRYVGAFIKGYDFRADMPGFREPYEEVMRAAIRLERLEEAMAGPNGLRERHSWVLSMNPPCLVDDEEELAPMLVP